MGGVLSYHRRRSHIELADFDFRTKDHEIVEVVRNKDGIEAVEHCDDGLVSELVICELGVDITDSISGYVSVDLTGRGFNSFLKTIVRRSFFYLVFQSFSKTIMSFSEKNCSFLKTTHSFLENEKRSFLKK